MKLDERNAVIFGVVVRVIYLVLIGLILLSCNRKTLITKTDTLIDKPIEFNIPLNINGVDTTLFFIVDSVEREVVQVSKVDKKETVAKNATVVQPTNIKKVVDRSRTKINIRQVEKIKNSDIGTLNNVRNISSDSTVSLLSNQNNKNTLTSHQRFLSMLKDNLFIVILIIVVIFLIRFRR